MGCSPRGHRRVVRVPFGLVSLGFVERFANHVLHAHAGGRIARLHRCAPSSAAAALRIAGALGIFAQRELDAGRGACEDHLLRVLAPAHLEHQGLPADGVGRAVQNVGRGHAAGQRAVNGDVVGVDDVLDVHHRGDRDAAFVELPSDPAMCEWQSMMPGITYCPPASIMVAPAGTITFSPISANLAVSDHDRALEDALGPSVMMVAFWITMVSAHSGAERQQRAAIKSFSSVPSRSRIVGGRATAAARRAPPACISCRPQTPSPPACIVEDFALVTTRLAILPFSMLPTRSATP